jgi:hypothetical protein
VVGEKPFRGDSITAILSKILTETPAPIDAEELDLPPALESVLQRAMAKEPPQRFESAGELLRAARQAAEKGTVAAPAPRETTGTVVAAAVSAPAPPTRSRRGRWIPVAAGLGAAALLVGSFLVVQALRSATPPASTPGGGLVVEEPVGFFGRVLGREPRLLITVPAATTLQLDLQTPISSATSSVGDAFTAEVREPVEVEEVEAVRGGARVFGRLSNVTTAEEGRGRGALTLEFETVTLVDGRELDIEAIPVVLRAPAPRRQNKKGLIAGIAGAGAALGGLIGGKKGALAGAALGGVTGAGIAYSETGADIELPAGSGFEVQLAAPVVVTRVRDP